MIACIPYPGHSSINILLGASIYTFKIFHVAFFKFSVNSYSRIDG